MSGSIAGDLVFEVVWPGNTTPVAADGTGTAPISLGGWNLFNVAAAARYVRFFNKGSAPTMGTDTAVLVIALAASGGKDVTQLLRPHLFEKGLWLSVTTGIADTDNSAPAASDVLVNVFYQ